MMINLERMPLFNYAKVQRNFERDYKTTSTKVEVTTWMVILSSELVLLGDSIIDNKSYVLDGEFSVLEHLKSNTEKPVTQLALDGATTNDVITANNPVIPADNLFQRKAGGC